MTPYLAAVLTLLSNTPVAFAHKCTHPPTYSDDNASAFIPFSQDNRVDTSFPDTNAFFDIAVQTSLSPERATFFLAMDTGSLGVAISATSLSLGPVQLDDCPQPGTEYLSSSRRLWEGCWVESSVYFSADGQRQVEARIPVLAVTENATCTEFTGGACLRKTDVTRWPKGIRYMGVGFGRGSSEQPQATPDKNPLLNVVAVDGERVETHAGYVVTQTGVHVGLTADNTRAFRQTKLVQRSDSSAPRDWQMVDMAISIDGLPSEKGLALFDTGIPQSYVRVSNATYQGLARKGFCQGVRNSTILCPKSEVKVLVGDGMSPVGEFDVVVGDPHEKMDPVEFRMERPSSSGTFINTGRHFYYGFEAMLDGKCGWFGLRKRTGSGGELASGGSQQVLEP